MSSGVEVSKGIKDHDKMRAFVAPFGQPTRRALEDKDHEEIGGWHHGLLAAPSGESSLIRAGAVRSSFPNLQRDCHVHYALRFPLMPRAISAPTAVFRCRNPVRRARRTEGGLCRRPGRSGLPVRRST